MSRVGLQELKEFQNLSLETEIDVVAEPLQVNLLYFYGTYGKFMVNLWYFCLHVMVYSSTVLFSNKLIRIRPEDILEQITGQR